MGGETGLLTTLAVIIVAAVAARWHHIELATSVSPGDQPGAVRPDQLRYRGTRPASGVATDR